MGERLVDPIVDVHCARPGEPGVPRCGAENPVAVASWEAVTDPRNPVRYGCPDCWVDAAGPGAEPMGGGQR
jgi:hypothetical protein